MTMPAAEWTMPLEGARLLSLQQADGILTVSLETDARPITCPTCQSGETVGYGRMKLRVQDLPLAPLRVYLDIRRARMRCNHCSRTFNEPLRGVSEHHRATERLIKLVRKMALNLPFTTISRELGMDEKTVRTIFNDHLASLRALPAPHSPEAVLLWLPVFLRSQRAVWVNPAQCTLLAMSADASPASLQEGLQQLVAHGTRLVYVPPDAGVITTLATNPDVTLQLHGPTLRAACERIARAPHASQEAIRYGAALERFIAAASETQAEDCWANLTEPPAALRIRMRPILAAVAAMGPGRFAALATDDGACGAQLAQLEAMLASGFSRRSYDVMHAVMMYDKHLYLTRRTALAEAGGNASLAYQKRNYGTAVGKLLIRLQGMAVDSKDDLALV